MRARLDAKAGTCLATGFLVGVAFAAINLGWVVWTGIRVWSTGRIRQRRAPESDWSEWGI